MRDLILASTSPRRQNLLTKMGLNFTILESQYIEKMEGRQDASALTAEFALAKASSVAQKHQKAVVIGGDTVVALGDQVFGKPKDEAEARAMLDQHFGKTAVIHTALAVVCQELNIEIVEVATARVVFKPYNEVEVEKYIQSGDWKDKAGAWGLRSGAAPLVQSVDGDRDVISGLPTKILATILRDLGFDPHTVDLRP
ncbi:MAG TPA: Maf family nucleotide pyrophosphatase [Patescibacteria group bacterium]|nr:Maf family nucleotide pyrophosphatase [Patescibacteria group bacterium]